MPSTVQELEYKIAVADFETDPFNGKPVYPFVCELLLSEFEYYQFWGPDCVQQLVDFLDNLPDKYIIYFHNGGRFDFFLRMGKGGKSLMHFFSGKIKIINRRIVKAFIGKHECRDSFAVFPEALATFKGKHSKQADFDYDKMTMENRDKHRVEILNYLHDDCLTLHEHCEGFHKEFGDNLTIGGTAMKQLRKRHEFAEFKGYDAERLDAEYRQFYYGGRTQCFKTGYIKGAYQIYDVNGMYQHVMREFMHPISDKFTVSDRIKPRTDFAIIEAENYGALPFRTQNGVDFNVESGTFYATMHEINAGEETGTLRIKRVIETRSSLAHSTFTDFIDHFYNSRLEMKRIGDGMRDGFYKRIMNSAYGKFAQNPEYYKDYEITLGNPDNLEKWIGDGWRECSRHDGWVIWEREARRKAYLNVATAASITGAARALLLRGLCAATDPVYCDTDSIICLGIGSGVCVDSSKLGAWKHEGKKGPNGEMIFDADSIAIAGKKMYAVFGELDGEEFSMKQACKGVRLTASQIRDIASGKEQFVKYENPAPSFDLAGGVRFIHRKVRATGQSGRLMPGAV